MIKRIIILIAAVIFATSCSFQPSKEYIRKTVVKKYPNMEIRPYSGFLRHFAECYFRYPDDMEEFVHFLEKWKENDSFFAVMEQFEECDLIKELNKRTVYYASYVDSAFFLVPSIDAGSSVVGTPQFWQENPGAYPEIIYRPRFAISGFDSEGEYVFEDYESLRNCFESVRKNYSNRILRTGASIEPLSRKVYDSLVYLSLIYAYNVDEDSFYLSEMIHIPAPDSLFSTKGIIADAIPLNMDNKSIEDYCKEYLYDIQTEVKKYLEGKKTIKKMLMVIPICF